MTSHLHRLRSVRVLLLTSAATLLLSCATAPAGDAIEPAEVTFKPTWGCMGINWPFAGDDNRNASVAVEFRRKGSEQWRPALALWLREFQGKRMFSGSVFRLCPGTEYEFKLTLNDADGGSAQKTLAASTLEYPRLPAKSVVVKEGGLAKAQELAEPGTIMRLSAGTYPAEALTKSGTKGQWIVYATAGDGEVVVEGTVNISADYVWLHGLTMQSPKNAIEASSRNVCITACRMKAFYDVHTGHGAWNYYIADNVLTGIADNKFTMGGEGVDFGSGAGSGHAVCYNEITDTADGVSYGGGNIDVYGNYIHETLDDFLEPDYAHENYRLWDNLCFNSMCGVSWQPMKGGPWYVFNNVLVGNYLHALKVKDVTGPTVLYGNTMLGKSAQIGQMADILRGTLVNNLWLRATPGPLGESGKFDPGADPTLVDYNAYGHGSDSEPFVKIGYKELVGKFGWDKHSVNVDYADLFVETVKVPAGSPHYMRGMQGFEIPADWKFEHNLLEPKPGTKIIDAGCVLPNLTGPYLGKAPDIGAHEAGLGTAWYGPRVWDEAAGITYGLPKGWKKLPLDKCGDYAAIGCLAPKQSAWEPRVLLAGESPRAFAIIGLVAMNGEDRWKQARQLMDSYQPASSTRPAASQPASDSLDTGVLEFQDGLYIRLSERGDNAIMTITRVEPDGVLIVKTGCAKKDLPALRTTLFQFARSFFR